MAGSTWLWPVVLLLCATESLTGQGGSSVSGVVLDSSGRPVDGACVLSAKPDAWLTQQVLAHPTARTMKDGTFLCPLKVGEDVVIAAPGKSALQVYTHGSGVELGPFVLSEGQALKGRVLDPEGRPIAGVTVDVQDWIGTGFPVTKTSRARTDEGGEFAALCVPARQLALVLTKEGYVTRRIGPVSVSARVQEQMVPGHPPTLPVSAAGSHRERTPVSCELVGRVLDQAGAPIIGARVWSSDYRLEEFRGSVPGDAATTDSEGKFHVTTVPTRRSWLYAWHSEYTVSSPIRMDLDAETAPKVIEIRMSPGEAIVGRFDGRIGPGWHVQADDVTEHGAADPLPTPPRFVPIAPDGSFRIPRLTKGQFWVAVVIPSLDEIGEPISRLVNIVKVPQLGGELVIDADDYRLGFVEGVARLSRPGAWRRLVVLAQEERPPAIGIGGGTWLVPEPRYSVLDAEGRFRLGLRPGYYEFSVADPLTGLRLHTWAGAVHLRADDSIQREVDLALTEVPLIITPPEGASAWFEGFTMGINWRPRPEFWNDVLDQPRRALALFGPSGTYILRGRWHDATGALHEVRDEVQFDASDPRPVRVCLKANQR